MKETAINQEFASVEFCQQLTLLGITKDQVYNWRRFSEDWHIWTFEFDADGYYKDGYLLLKETVREELVPAFSLKDLERCIPDYLLQRTGTDGYLLSCDPAFHLPPVRCSRLPDAFATMLIEMILKDKYPIEYFNKKLVPQ